jgi:hypothetical protein
MIISRAANLKSRERLTALHTSQYIGFLTITIFYAVWILSLRLGNRHPHESPPALCLEANIFARQMSSLGAFFDFFHGIPLPLVLREEIVNGLSVGRGNCVLLGEVVLLDHWVGELIMKIWSVWDRWGYEQA